MLALDEKRTAFMPTLMNEEDRVNEVWFPGAHADVGGGFWYDGLSDLTLEFMTSWINKYHAEVNILPLNNVDYHQLEAPDGSYRITKKIY